MTTSEAAAILAAVNDLKVEVAEVKGDVKHLRSDDDRQTKESEALRGRVDKLERIAYVALGIAIASGLPQAASLIR